MRKLTLLITSLLCYVGVLHAEALVAAPTVAEVATFAELQAALAAENELPIIINAQIEISADETVTIDLNGKTVNSVFNGTSTTNHIYALSNKGTLTILDSKGNGSINSRGIYNYGSLTLNAGAINAIDGNGGYAVNNQNGSTFVMNGGVVAATYEDDHQSSSGGYDATALKVPAGCTATLNGGTINNVCDFTYAIDAVGTLNIPATSTITVNGTHGAIYVSGGETTIDAGTFQIPVDNYSRTDNVLYVSGGSLVVNGGTFIGDSDTASGGSCLYDAAGKAVVNGGTFKGSSGGDVWGTTGTTINGGTFENLTEKQHIAAGYELNADGTVAMVSVAEVNGTKYASLAEAVAAAQNNETITLVSNIELAEVVTIPADKTLTIDLNGKTITCGTDGYCIENTAGSTVTIKDTNGNGVVNGTIYNQGGSTMIIDGGTYNAIGKYALLNDAATMTINGGIINGKDSYPIYSYNDGHKLTINNVTVNGECGCINAYYAGEVIINDGTFNFTGREGYTYHIVYVSTGTTMTINGGTFKKVGDVDVNGEGGGGICANGTGKLIITGGTFDGAISDIDNYSSNTTIEVSGGNFSDNSAKNYVANGFELKQNADGTYGVVEAPTEVATLAELQAALADNSSELPIIITETIVIPEGETVVLDLNGKTVTRQDEANQYALRNLGDLTIKDTKGNGSINARGIYNGYGDGAANVATAKITVLSGTINAKGTNGGAAVYNYGIAEIKGGTFTSIGGYSLNSQSGASMTIADGVTANNGIYVSGATLVVDGGEISGNRSGCHVLYAWNSTVTINGGEFYNNNSGNSTTMAAGTTELTINGGTFGIKDGRVPGNGNTWTSCLTDTQNSATMTVNGGTFNGGFRVQGGTTMTIAGGEFNDCYGSGYNIYGTAIVKGGTFTDDAAKTFAGKYLAENFKLNEEGSVVAAPVAAKIGETKYETLEAAFAAAAEDATITLLADATPALTSQRAITKAAEIDLGGYTLTLTEDDLYFGTIDFRNGNIVVDPSVKPSTAVFWMFKDQVLTFENVKLTATGVTGTYLIGLDGNNADLNLFSSEIIVDNTTALDLDIICVNASTGNDIWMEDSKVTVKNLDGRVFFRGNYTVAGKSEINLEGVTKAGFRIEAGQTLTIKDNAVVNIVGEPRDGGIHLTDASANYTKAETATVNATVNEPKVAKIGETTYKTLQAAIEAVQEGETIILVDNVNVTTPAYGQNALNHARAINFTLDLNGKTLSANTGNSVFRFNIANSGATSNVTLTIKNGKIVAGSNTWCAVMASGISADVKAIMNLENLTIEASKAGDLAVKAWDNATINANNVTVNATNAAGGFYAVGGEIVLDNCTVNQKGLHTAPYLSMAFAVSSNGKMTINSGTYSADPTAAAEGYNQGSTHGSWVGGVMNSGGELIINGGTFSNGNFGDDALATAARGLIFADSNGKVTVNGGTFNALKSIFDFQNNSGTTSPVITVKGGNYSADPAVVTSYGSIVLAAGYTIEEKDGRYVVEKGLAGAGTEADPYVVNDVDDLVIFRNSVNAGETKYNADGVYVALGADIDLADEDWSVNIGDDCNATFDGIFDGKGHTISNLTAIETAQKADGYVCTGLFGAIYGNAVVKNFTIENVNINTRDFTGNNAAAVVGFAYAAKGSIENVTVKGDIQINAGKVTGTGAIVGYGYVSTMTVKKCQVIGNDGSAIIGQAYVGGIIGYSNKDMLCGNIVQNIGVTATSCATGGVAGIMLSGGQAADNTVKDVTLVSTHANWKNAVGVVVGTITSGSVTIANTTFEGVNTTAIAGAVHADKPTTPVAKVAARNGNVYYTTIDAAMQADGNDVEVFVPVNLMDGEEYAYEKNCLVGELTYTRTLPAVNKWYAFFVPFEMSINDLPANVEVAMINDFHTTFDDADGSIVRQWVEYIIKRRGTLKAGHPYLIRATSEDALEFTIELEDAVLKSAAEKTAVTVSSAITSVTFEGVYASTPSSDNTSMVRYMAVNGNGVWDEFTGYNLNPFRILMTYTVLDEDYAVKEDAARAIGVRVIGEEDENGETVIYDVEMDSHEGVEYIYDLQGRRVLEPQKGGLYIVNGKKVIF